MFNIEYVLKIKLKIDMWLINSSYSSNNIERIYKFRQHGHNIYGTFAVIIIDNFISKKKSMSVPP